MGTLGIIIRDILGEEPSQIRGECSENQERMCSGDRTMSACKCGFPLEKRGIYSEQYRRCQQLSVHTVVRKEHCVVRKILSFKGRVHTVPRSGLEDPTDDKKRGEGKHEATYFRIQRISLRIWSVCRHDILSHWLFSNHRCRSSIEIQVSIAGHTKMNNLAFQNTKFQKKPNIDSWSDVKSKQKFECSREIRWETFTSLHWKLPWSHCSVRNVWWGKGSSVVRRGITL